MKLTEYIKSGIGLSGMQVSARKYRMFYPRKPRTCKECHFRDYDSHSFKNKGCMNGFKVSIVNNIQRPMEKCYPVMCEGYGYMSADHADKIAIQILKLKEK
jgi:hypothetical protein